VREDRDDGEDKDSDLCLAHGSLELFAAAEGAISPPPESWEALVDRDGLTETPMQHFHAGNLDKIKDTPPDTWATVHSRDAVTLSELARRGFYLVDMTGEVWTMRRAG